MDTIDKLFKSPIMYGLLAVSLGVYGPRLQPALPKPVIDLFNNDIFRLIIILTIAYLSSKDLQLSLIVTIAFLLIISLAHSHDVEEKFMIRCTERFTSDIDQSIQTFYGGQPGNNQGYISPEKCKELCKDVKPGDNLHEFCQKNTFPAANVENFDGTDKFDNDDTDMEKYENFLRQTVENYKFKL
jgi:hypothetical protein